MTIFLIILLIIVGSGSQHDDFAPGTLPIAPAANAIQTLAQAIDSLRDGADHMKFLSDWWPVPLNNSSVMNLSG